MRIFLSVIIGLLCTHFLSAQQSTLSKVWVADNGDGTYKNPVLFADYSDPDAIRVGNDYYLVASSFEDMPGLPILHSKDLVNWTIIGHALQKLAPAEYYSVPRHGGGVWAPAIRWHKGEFYIYYPDPDFGIYMVKASKPAGPWSAPILVEAGKGLIDPCPFWDTNGEAYLVHAFAGSRAGIKSLLVIKRLSADGSKVIDAGKVVFDGHEEDPTVEGPKLYKRNGYYYIFAPAGGVGTGWQLALRSKNIYGPYERRKVMDQGKSPVNGPHQGAWVDTENGEDWFLHFQDKGLYGRVLHLQPMKWTGDWPVIGTDKDGDGKGEPVMQHKKPTGGKTWPRATPADSDEFNDLSLGSQWQWMANPGANWYFMNPARGAMRLYALATADSILNLWQTPNVLLQKLPAESFMVTTKIHFTPNAKSGTEWTGLTVMGYSYASIGLKSGPDGIRIVYTSCKNAEKGERPIELDLERINNQDIYLRMKMQAGGQCLFSYSTDSVNYKDAGQPFQAETGRWIGAKMGLFCTRKGVINDAGYADIDWFRIEQLP